MLHLLGRIIGSILRSTLASIVMFLIFFSIVTHRFPPDFSQLQRSYRGLQELERAASQVATSNHEKEINSRDRDVAESDVENLEGLNLRRAKAGKALLNQADFSSKELSQPQVEENLANQVTELKSKVSQLELMIFKMQGRLDQLESHPTHPK